MQTQRAIALELRFAEPLISRRFMRKLRVIAGVAIYIVRDRDGPATMQGRLEINERPVVGAIRSIHRAVPNDRLRAVQALRLGQIRQYLDLALEFDRDSEIDADLANGIAEVLEGKRAVLPCVADQDVPAATQDHLVEP